MIISKIRLQEDHPMVGPTISWPLPVCDLNVDPSAGENGYILKMVKGLDPPNLIAVVEGFDSFGTPVIGGIPDKREIALRVGISPAFEQTYGGLRDAIYRFMNRTILISLMDDSTVLAKTTGYIRLCEAVYFSNQPELEITITCVDGEFTAPFAVDIPFVDLDSAQPVINYEDGTAPTGLDLQFTVTAPVPGFIIFNHSRVWFDGVADIFNEFELTYPLIADDVVTISTQTKNKRITLLRSAVEYDLAGYINAGAVWPKLYPGVNTFEWDIEDTWMTWDSASYFPKYWGV